MFPLSMNKEELGNRLAETPVKESGLMLHDRGISSSLPDKTVLYDQTQNVLKQDPHYKTNPNAELPSQGKKLLAESTVEATKKPTSVAQVGGDKTGSSLGKNLLDNELSKTKISPLQQDLDDRSELKPKLSSSETKLVSNTIKETTKKKRNSLKENLSDKSGPRVGLKRPNITLLDNQPQETSTRNADHLEQLPHDKAYRSYRLSPSKNQLDESNVEATSLGKNQNPEPSSLDQKLLDNRLDKKITISPRDYNDKTGMRSEITSPKMKLMDYLTLKRESLRQDYRNKSDLKDGSTIPNKMVLHNQIHEASSQNEVKLEQDHLNEASLNTEERNVEKSKKKVTSLQNDLNSERSSLDQELLGNQLSKKEVFSLKQNLINETELKPGLLSLEPQVLDKPSPKKDSLKQDLNENSELAAALSMEKRVNGTSQYDPSAKTDADLKMTSPEENVVEKFTNKRSFQKELLLDQGTSHKSMMEVPSPYKDLFGDDKNSAQQGGPSSYDSTNIDERELQKLTGTEGLPAAQVSGLKTKRVEGLNPEFQAKERANKDNQQNDADVKKNFPVTNASKNMKPEKKDTFLPNARVSYKLKDEDAGSRLKPNYEDQLLINSGKERFNIQEVDKSLLSGSDRDQFATRINDAETARQVTTPFNTPHARANENSGETVPLLDGQFGKGTALGSSNAPLGSPQQAPEQVPESVTTQIPKQDYPNVINDVPAKQPQSITSTSGPQMRLDEPVIDKELFPDYLAGKQVLLENHPENHVVLPAQSQTGSTSHVNEAEPRQRSRGHELGMPIPGDDTVTQMATKAEVNENDVGVRVKSDKHEEDPHKREDPGQTTQGELKVGDILPSRGIGMNEDGDECGNNILPKGTDDHTPYASKSEPDQAMEYPQTTRHNGNMKGHSVEGNDEKVEKSRILQNFNEPETPGVNVRRLGDHPIYRSGESATSAHLDNDKHPDKEPKLAHISEENSVDSLSTLSQDFPSFCLDTSQTSEKATDKGNRHSKPSGPKLRRKFSFTPQVSSAVNKILPPAPSPANGSPKDTAPQPRGISNPQRLDPNLDKSQNSNEMRTTGNASTRPPLNIEKREIFSTQLDTFQPTVKLSTLIIDSAQISSYGKAESAPLPHQTTSNWDDKSEKDKFPISVKSRTNGRKPARLKKRASDQTEAQETDKQTMALKHSSTERPLWRRKRPIPGEQDVENIQQPKVSPDGETLGQEYCLVDPITTKGTREEATMPQHDASSYQLKESSSTQSNKKLHKSVSFSFFPDDDSEKNALSLKSIPAMKFSAPEKQGKYALKSPATKTEITFRNIEDLSVGNKITSWMRKSPSHDNHGEDYLEYMPSLHESMRDATTPEVSQTSDIIDMAIQFSKQSGFTSTSFVDKSPLSGKDFHTLSEISEPRSELPSSNKERKSASAEKVHRKRGVKPPHKEPTTQGKESPSASQDYCFISGAAGSRKSLEKTKSHGEIKEPGDEFYETHQLTKTVIPSPAMQPLSMAGRLHSDLPIIEEDQASLQSLNQKALNIGDSTVSLHDSVSTATTAQSFTRPSSDLMDLALQFSKQSGFSTYSKSSAAESIRSDVLWSKSNKPGGEERISEEEKLPCITFPGTSLRDNQNRNLNIPTTQTFPILPSGPSVHEPLRAASSLVSDASSIMLDLALQFSKQSGFSTTSHLNSDEKPVNDSLHSLDKIPEVDKEVPDQGDGEELFSISSALNDMQWGTSLFCKRHSNKSEQSSLSGTDSEEHPNKIYSIVPKTSDLDAPRSPSPWLSKLNAETNSQQDYKKKLEKIMSIHDPLRLLSRCDSSTSSEIVDLAIQFSKDSAYSTYSDWDGESQGLEQKESRKVESQIDITTTRGALKETVSATGNKPDACEKTRDQHGLLVKLEDSPPCPTEVRLQKEVQSQTKPRLAEEKSPIDNSSLIATSAEHDSVKVSAPEKEPIQAPKQPQPRKQENSQKKITLENKPRSSPDQKITEKEKIKNKLDQGGKDFGKRLDKTLKKSLIMKPTGIEKSKRSPGAKASPRSKTPTSTPTGSLSAKTNIRSSSAPPGVPNEHRLYRFHRPLTNMDHLL